MDKMYNELIKRIELLEDKVKVLSSINCPDSSDVVLMMRDENGVMNHYDKHNNIIYSNDKYGNWTRKKYDDNGDVIYKETADDYYEKTEHGYIEMYKGKNLREYYETNGIHVLIHEILLETQSDFTHEHCVEYIVDNYYDNSGRLVKHMKGVCTGKIPYDLRFITDLRLSENDIINYSTNGDIEITDKIDNIKDIITRTIVYPDDTRKVIEKFKDGKVKSMRVSEIGRASCRERVLRLV